MASETLKGSTDRIIRLKKKTLKVTDPKLSPSRTIKTNPEPIRTLQKPAPNNPQPQPLVQQPPATSLLGGVQQPAAGLMSNNLEMMQDDNQAQVLVNTKYGSRMMSMREYDAYIQRLEDEERQKQFAKDEEKRIRRENREKRRQEKKEALENEKAKRKDFIVPQAMFGIGQGDPYMKDKVFPPHLYPHLYPEKFPELFPHIYGEQIKKKKALEKAQRDRERQLLLFRDPRARKIPPERLKM